MGLLFDVNTGKFYKDINNDGAFTSDTDSEYTGQDDKWGWDGNTKTLTLNGFEWTTSAESALTIISDDSNNNLIIQLQTGSVNSFISTVESDVENSDSRGIYATTSITIQGDGTLNAIAGKAYFSEGLDVENNLTITGGTVNATSGNAQLSSYGIYINGSISITGGTLNATGGNGQSSYGLISNTISITGGTVTAIGETGAFNSQPTTLPAGPYLYWTNTTVADPGGNGTDGSVTPFNYSSAYKYVRIQKILPPSVPSYGINIGTLIGGTIVTEPEGDVAQGATVNMTITPDEGYKLNSVSVCKTDDSSIEVDLNEGTYSFEMPEYGVTISATFTNMNEEAKTLIEQGNYTIDQQTANTEAALKTWLISEINSLISAIPYDITESNITISNFEAAVTNGANGRFDFSVALNKGEEAIRATASASGIILAEDPQPSQKNEITTTQSGSGSVQLDKGMATEGETVTVTVSPASGYVLSSLVVYKRGNGWITTTVNGTGNTRTFIMPDYSVVVRTVFQKSDALLNQEAVEAAIAAVTGGTYTMAQGSATTEAQVKTWLLNTLNYLFGEAHGIEFRSTGDMIGNVTVTEFTEAENGTETNPLGTDGSFKFKVTINKGNASETTNEVEGVIKATPYSDNPTSIDEVKTPELRAYVTDGTLYVTGLTVGKPWRVYTITGSLIHAATASADEDKITLSLRGIYIITTQKESLKVAW